MELVGIVEIITLSEKDYIATKYNKTYVRIKWTADGRGPMYEVTDEIVLGKQMFGLNILNSDARKYDWKPIV